MFTGKLSSLPPVTWSRNRDYRLIRPLCFVTEDITTAYAASMGIPVIPCGCSQRTGTVRRALRDLFAGLEQEHPHLKENMLSAMGNVDTSRLLDTRFLNDAAEMRTDELFPIVTEL
jgi:tRNA 2-thiocytidine biosynthesis protein TtcA